MTIPTGPSSSSNHPEPTWSPRRLGYRMPGEFEHHQATWLSWPHNSQNWPGRLNAVQRVFAQIVAAIVDSEKVHINVDDGAMEATARYVLADYCDVKRIDFHQVRTNEPFCRDHGAMIVARAFESSVAPPLLAIDWRYNAFGCRAAYALDNAVARQMAQSLDMPLISGGMVLEAGSIEVNGSGLLIATESCLLNPNRNPEFSRQQIEGRLQAMLGIEEMIWLNQGLSGDGVDGRVDNLARFVGNHTLAVSVEYNVVDDNQKRLRENFEFLSDYRRKDGSALNVVALPMPEPITVEGRRMPASYANFYIANHVVIVPVFNQPNDAKACDVLRTLFPSRKIVPIECTEIIGGTGTVHCLAQQIPLAPHSANTNHLGLLV